MPITILHTSDWHIAKPFGQLAPEIRGVLQQARLTACARIAAAALEGGARHVLVAGDVLDRPTLPDRDLRAVLAQMQAHPSLSWHIIPGNHDPAARGGVWERVARLGLPANVLVHLEAKAIEIEPRCWLLPAPLSTRAMSTDPTAWMDAATTPEGDFRIGLAHGSIQGFGSEASASVRIAPDRPRLAGLDYLALGDWHGVREIGPRAAYSGTPEPDGYLDNAPGRVLLVTLEGRHAMPRIEHCEVGEHRWLKRTIAASRLTDLAALETEIEALGAKAARAMVGVEITGRMTMSEASALTARLDRLDARVLHLERRLDQLVLAPADDDLDRLPEGHVRNLGRELSHAAADAAAPGHRVAGRALRHLFELNEQIVDASDGGAR
jgi:DNA repair exonuclease SbcCD nuclease subunit